MNKKMKVLLCLLLIAVQMLLVACGGGGTTAPDGTTEPSEGTTAPPVTTEEPFELPDMNFDGATFGIAGLIGGIAQDCYFVEEDTGSGLSSAVADREMQIETEFGITFEYTTWMERSTYIKNARQALYDSIMAGEDATIDLYLSSVVYTEELLHAGLFSNLAGSQYLNLDRPWYVQSVNDWLGYKGSLFYCTGAYNLTTLSGTNVMFWNREFSEDLQIEDNLFEVVHDGEWTYDRMLTLAQRAVNGLDGEDATYGIGMTITEGINALAMGMGRQIQTLDENGVPSIEVLGSARNVDILEEMIELYARKDLVNGDGIPLVADLCKLFQSNRALFAMYTMSMGELQEMRDGVDYSFLPIPKGSEEQEDYVCVAFPMICAIPATVKDRVMSEVILDALNYYSMGVYDTYYEDYYGYKIARDDDCKAMLDIIRDSQYCDFSLANYPTVSSELYYIGTITNPASWWASNRDAFLASHNALLLKMEELINAGT